MEKLREQLNWLLIASKNESQHTTSYVTYNLLLEFQKTLNKYIDDNTRVHAVRQPVPIGIGESEENIETQSLFDM